MENKVKILETLNSVKEGTNKMSVSSLEILINFNNDFNFFGGDFLELLLQMKTEGLIESDLRNWN